MTERIDVLADLDRVSDLYDIDLSQTRSAVAELIAAVRQLDKFTASTAWDDLSDTTAETTRLHWQRIKNALASIGATP